MPSEGPSAVGFSGKVSDNHIEIRVRRGSRFSLPWRGTFRGATFPLDGGTAIAGKFDSNWSLYFFGYPILAGVLINIAVNVFAGHGAGRFAEFTIFTIVAALVCGTLHWINDNDKRLIVAAMCRVTSAELDQGPY
jgi:hypothetical protein